MKILLDECLPRRLLRDLSEYMTTTVPRQGWAGTKDRDLIELAEEEFDVFITIAIWPFSKTWKDRCCALSCCAP